MGGVPKYPISGGEGGRGGYRGGHILPHFLGRGGRGVYLPHYPGEGGSQFTPFPGEGGGGGGTGGGTKNSQISRYGGGVSPVLRGGYLESHLSD